MSDSMGAQGGHVGNGRGDVHDGYLDVWYVRAGNHHRANHIVITVYSVLFRIGKTQSEISKLFSLFDGETLQLYGVAKYQIL